MAKSPRRFTKRQAAAATPPDDDGIGSPHESLTEEQKLIWAELSEQAPARLLRKSDRATMEVLVRLLWKMRADKAKVSELQVIASLLSKFGMDPRGRESVTIPEPPREPSVWDQFVPKTLKR